MTDWDHAPAWAAEFPNDNPSLHEGVSWVCLSVLGPAKPIARPRTSTSRPLRRFAPVPVMPVPAEYAATTTARPEPPAPAASELEAVGCDASPVLAEGVLSVLLERLDLDLTPEPAPIDAVLALDASDLESGDPTPRVTDVLEGIAFSDDSFDFDGAEIPAASEATAPSDASSDVPIAAAPETDAAPSDDAPARGEEASLTEVAAGANTGSAEESTETAVPVAETTLAESPTVAEVVAPVEPPAPVESPAVVEPAASATAMVVEPAAVVAPVAPVSVAVVEASPAVASEPDAYGAFVAALVSVLLAAGATRAGAVLPTLLEAGAIDESLLDADSVRALGAAKVIDQSSGRICPTPDFVATSRAWREVLRGQSNDLSACGTSTLDGWAGDLLRALGVGRDGKVDVRRELRRRGVAAFGMLNAA